MNDSDIRAILQQRKAYERMKSRLYEAAIIPMLLTAVLIVLAGAH